MLGICNAANVQLAEISKLESKYGKLLGFRHTWDCCLCQRLSRWLDRCSGLQRRSSVNCAASDKL